MKIYTITQGDVIFLCVMGFFLLMGIIAYIGKLHIALQQGKKPKLTPTEKAYLYKLLKALLTQGYFNLQGYRYALNKHGITKSYGIDCSQHPFNNMTEFIQHIVPLLYTEDARNSVKSLMEQIQPEPQAKYVDQECFDKTIQELKEFIGK